jgi:hypothetical protein
LAVDFFERLLELALPRGMIEDAGSVSFLLKPEDRVLLRPASNGTAVSEES